jgi:predicted permease
MTRLIEILQTILPVVIMLGIGMICRSRKIISREGIGALKSVVVNIALPAVLLGAFATTKYTFMDVVIPLMMFGICVAAWALGKCAARLFHLTSRFVPFLTTGFEAGMLGYALFNMLYGSDRVADFARIDLGQVLFVFTLYKILLGLSGNEAEGAVGLADGAVDERGVGGLEDGDVGVLDVLAAAGIDHTAANSALLRAGSEA